MSKFAVRPSAVQSRLAELREELSLYLHRCRGRGSSCRWGYGALRELSNLNALQAEAVPRPARIQELLEGMAVASAVLAGAAGFLLFTEGKGSPPVRPVRLDRAALHTAFFNLVGNACRYSADRAARLTVRLSPRRCVLLLENTGDLPPAHGLGLSAAAAAAERMGGGLRLLGCGGRVFAGFTFPLVPAGEESCPESPAPAEYLADPFSPAYIYLADLGHIPGCAQQTKRIY